MSVPTEVKIKITWTDERALRIDSPFFRADRHICNVGTNNAAVLVFDRPDELADYNLMLRFTAGGVPYKEDISLGPVNTYELHNAFTQAEDLSLVILLYDGDNRLAASNAGAMRLLPDGHVRGLPVDGYEIVPYLIPGEKGNDGDKGNDGVSPEASVTQTATGVLLTVTDGSGTTTAELLNGNDGRDGIDGAPGRDGADGAPGAKGDTGAKGADGYTPQRGVDYWTAADIAEIHGYIDTQLGVIEDGYY